MHSEPGPDIVLVLELQRTRQPCLGLFGHSCIPSKTVLFSAWFLPFWLSWLAKVSTDSLPYNHWHWTVANQALIQVRVDCFLHHFAALTTIFDFNSLSTVDLVVPSSPSTYVGASCGNYNTVEVRASFNTTTMSPIQSQKLNTQWLRFLAHWVTSFPSVHHSVMSE